MAKKDFVKLNRETYNKIARPFGLTRQYLWDDLLPLKKYTKDNYKVLDLGCGTGRLYHLFKDFQDVKYVGADQSAGQIAVAREKLPGVNFQIAEMTKLPFKKGEFDVVYCIATFHHLPDEKSRVKSLQEMKRVVKPGSYIIMTNWNLFSKTARQIMAKGKFEEIKPNDFIIPWLNQEGKILGKRYYHAFKLEELENLFKKIGFKLEDQYYTKKGGRGGVDDPGNIVSILQK